MRKIVVAHRVQQEAIDILAPCGQVDANTTPEPWPRAELIRRCQGATALLSFMTEWVDEAFLAACPDIRMIACALKGYDNYDVDACRRHGVTICVVPDLLTAPTAELTVGLMIALGRRVLASDRYVRTGEFQGWRPTFYGMGLDGSTVGIVGMGAVGQAVASRLRGFGCFILYHDALPPAPAIPADVGARRCDLNELLSKSDYVVVVLPITADTVHLIDADALACMRTGALLINVGRGSVVDEEAVADSLAAGRLGGYAADVFAMEDWRRPERPATIPPRLVALCDHTVLTSHIGSAVDTVRRQIALAAAHSIAQYLDGRVPQGILAGD